MCRVSSPLSGVAFAPDLLLPRAPNGAKMPMALPSKPRQVPPTIAKRRQLPLPSILRKRSIRHRAIEIPKLVPVHDGTDVSCLSRESSDSSIQSTGSFSCHEHTKKVSFYHKVVVQEFQRLPGEDKTTWYNAQDMKAFQKEVANLVRQYDRTHSTWLGFLRRPHRILHSHPALASLTDEDEDTPTVQNQVKRILLVDSHDLSLQLFARSFQTAFPHAIIHTASGSQDALKLCEKTTFDLVVADERLSLFQSHSQSGSGLLKMLSKNMPKCLFVGVSAHLKRDQSTLKENGADLCWSKPPPPLNKTTLQEMFQTLMTKRQGEV